MDAISLMVAAAIVPGISFRAPDGLTFLIAAAAAAFTLGIVNLLVRPLILLLALPLGFFVDPYPRLLRQCAGPMIVPWLLPTFQVDGLMAAFLGGLVLAAVNTVVTGVMTVD